MSVITGTVAFANLTEHESFNGTSTGKYSLVVVVDDDSKATLENEGVKLKVYKNQPQRKFATKFEDFAVIDADGEKIPKAAVRWGDKVKVKYNVGKPHPVYGSSTYLQAIRVVEKAEVEGDDDSDF